LVRKRSPVRIRAWAPLGNLYDRLPLVAETSSKRGPTKPNGVGPAGPFVDGLILLLASAHCVHGLPYSAQMIEWLDIEEAALLVGRSAATLRRWAADGVVLAEKRGKSWRIDRASLGRSAPQGTVRAEVAGLNIAAAWMQVKRDLGRRGGWVPDVLAYADHLAYPEEIKSAAAERLANAGPFDPAVPVEVPKNPLITRNGVVLSVEDLVAYQASVQSIAIRVERQLSSSVFSYRLDSSERREFLSAPAQWVKWVATVAKAVENGHSWMVEADIVSYFDVIQHEPLFAAIGFLNTDQTVRAALKRMLSLWSGERKIGIPQGPDISSVLGNLYLIPVDNAMESSEWLFFRYMDDIRIVGRSRGAVLAGLRILERECRKLGLTLAPSKTREHYGDEAVASLRDTRLDAAAYSWKILDYEAATELTRPILRSSLDKAEPEARLLRFAFYRLAALGDTQDVGRVMERLEYLGHVAPYVARYLWHSASEPTTIAGICKFLCDEDRNTSPVLASWLLATLIDRNSSIEGGLAIYVRRTMKDNNQPKFLRVLAANLLAASGAPTDLAWLRSQIQSEYDPFVLRGFIVAIARAGTLNSGAVKSLAKQAPYLRRTLDFLRGRQRLPNLVYEHSPTSLSSVHRQVISRHQRTNRPGVRRARKFPSTTGRANQPKRAGS